MSVHPGLLKTVRHILPYEIWLMLNGKACIKNTRGQILCVTRGEVEKILQRDDLDAHRRRMYEATLEVFNTQK